ncbi:hypothetical protein E2C01_069827 [Portunus trituberculatus]|uniref:Uncharacterized protein n=1 Tax=Portunus trituberculatus TaxID=210409 RepID=A0A5B7HSK5_PORTR|nr:hypothetical protein [Portunus trituberculatus]
MCITRSVVTEATRDWSGLPRGACSSPIRSTVAARKNDHRRSSLNVILYWLPASSSRGNDFRWNDRNFHLINNEGCPLSWRAGPSGAGWVRRAADDSTGEH